MCGIFGVVNPSTMTKTQIDFLSDSFIAGGVRGLHGSGMFTVDRTNRITASSEAKPGTSFIKSDKAKDVNRSLNLATLAVGHNRFATSGDHEDDHCHPFEFGDIVGVHNGGIPDPVLNIIDPEDSHDVDSGRLYAAISRVDNPIDVLEKVHSGAYALVWYDKRTDSLHIARNHGRPMHIAVTKTSLYFASELGMLTWLMGRNNLEDSSTEICSLDTKKLYTIPMSGPQDVTSEEYSAPYPTYGSNAQYDEYSASDADKSGNNKETGKAQANLFLPGGKDMFMENDGRYRVFYTEHPLTRMFPCLRSRMEFIQDNVSCIQESGILVIPSLMYGIALSNKHMKYIYGAVSSPDGQKQYNDVLAVARGSNCLVDSYEKWLPEPGLGIKDSYYPVIWQTIESFKVRPTGELIVQGRPLPSLPPETSISGVEFALMDWAKYASSQEYLEKQSLDQLMYMWQDLQDGKVVFDDYDIPF